ncbi:MAG: mechanosensitive ion channel family protein [Gammaproteobacteria bacterium]|nr:mechanosensitive ion channel family protein [Gammaproteobacteria bacterium]
MDDETEITASLLYGLGNWLKPYMALIGENLYLQSFLILLVSLSIAKLSSYIIMTVVLRLARNTKTNLDNQIVGILHAPIFYTVILLGTGAAIYWLDLPPRVHDITVSIVGTVGIFIWGLFFIRLFRILIISLAYRKNNASLIRVETLPLFLNISVVVICALGIYMIFQAWNIDMTAWLASAGIVGIAIGFAAKDTLANLFSGVFIMVDAPYKIGDFIVLDSGERGEVTHIGIRSTRILTRDDIEVTIPNSIMGNTKIINESGGPHKKYRIRIKVSVAYGTEVDQVRKVLMDVAMNQAGICQSPEPRVRFRELGDSGLHFELLCWIDEPVLRGRALDAMNEQVYKQFLIEGIEIPYNKQDIYIKDFPDSNQLKSGS